MTPHIPCAIFNLYQFVLHQFKSILLIEVEYESEKLKRPMTTSRMTDVPFRGGSSTHTVRDLHPGDHAPSL